MLRPQFPELYHLYEIVPVFESVFLPGLVRYERIVRVCGFDRVG